MGDYLNELIEVFVGIYNAEAGSKDIVVFGGDDISRERFRNGIEGRGCRFLMLEES